MNKNKDDSHTTREDFVRGNIAAGVYEYDELVVKTVTLDRLFSEFGVPYYLKCDIEGADEQVIDQLMRGRQRPPFVSFELSSTDIIRKIGYCGYKSFQVVNQWLNPTLKAPSPAREGNYVECSFTGHSSGFFGSCKRKNG